MKKCKDEKGNVRVSVKTSRYNRNCVNLFRDLDGSYDHKHLNSTSIIIPLTEKEHLPLNVNSVNGIKFYSF